MGRRGSAGPVVAMIVALAEGGCRKETMVAVDGGAPSTVMPAGAAGGDSRSLGKDKSAPAEDERYVVRLERSVCYGVCPAYSVEIGPDGAVAYDGRSFVGVRGRVSSRIGRVAVSALVERLESAGFFRLEWQDPCDRISTDSPTATITFVRGGRKRTIADYRGNGCMPPVLRELEDEVDRVAHTATWVKCDADYCNQ